MKEWRRQEGNGWGCFWDCVEMSERMEAVKEYLERMWRARSSRSKGLALERSRATCSIKIKPHLFQPATAALDSDLPSV
ncbi:hypothetical protein E2C01_016264 [Portunus trituberculatus]|uniref:Uncharacterized protein n=1 Tax=Portunus trituberculatus TaxID=210409 RepID=A0A5B7DQB5_PORTR|nr:hypothetical protein [Portunus trituberculatus]